MAYDDIQITTNRSSNKVIIFTYERARTGRLPATQCKNRFTKIPISFFSWSIFIIVSSLSNNH